MRLYSRWQNSAGERVRIALNLKSIDYEPAPLSNLGRIQPSTLMPIAW
jgi:glutathione S-transferase